MNALLSTISHDTRKEFSKEISLTALPASGQTVISNNIKFVCKEIVFVADQDAQIIADCHVRTTEELLKSWGFSDTSVVDYHEKPVADVILQFNQRKGHRK